MWDCRREIVARRTERPGFSQHRTWMHLIENHMLRPCFPGHLQMSLLLFTECDFQSNFSCYQAHLEGKKKGKVGGREGGREGEREGRSEGGREEGMEDKIKTQ